VTGLQGAPRKTLEWGEVSFFFSFSTNSLLASSAPRPSLFPCFQAAGLRLLPDEAREAISEQVPKLLGPLYLIPRVFVLSISTFPFFLATPTENRPTLALSVIPENALPLASRCKRSFLLSALPPPRPSHSPPPPGNCCADDPLGQTTPQPFSDLCFERADFLCPFFPSSFFSFILSRDLLADHVPSTPNHSTHSFPISHPLLDPEWSTVSAPLPPLPFPPLRFPVSIFLSHGSY